MWISPAYAQSAGGGDPGGFITLLPLVLIFVVFYFLLIRPQQKKVKAHRALIEALRRGDKVVTAGGLMGTVTKVTSETELQLEIAEGVRVRVVRGTIQDVLAKTEPAQKSAEKAKSGAQNAKSGAQNAKSGAQSAKAGTQNAKAANDQGESEEKPKGALGGLGSILGGGKAEKK